MPPDPIRQTFTAALDALIARVKTDRSILAAMLCGSLSHDTVWSGSDIDLVLITIDDSKVGQSDIALYADGVNVHAMLIPRAAFRKTVESAIHSSFSHSFLAKGRLLYTHDPTITELCARLQTRGGRDAAVGLLRAATAALPAVNKAHKWFVTRGDLDYTALWILYAATPLAEIEVISAGLLVDREVIQQAIALNPVFFAIVYRDLLNQPKSRERVQAALQAVDEYLAGRAPALFALVLEHLREAGEARSCKEIEDYFKKNYDISCVVTACEYLADQGLISKVSVTTRLTRKSNADVQELAFVLTTEPPNAF